MTIPTTASKVTQQGNGVTTVWPYAFEIPGSTTTDQTNVQVSLYDTTQSPPVTTILTNNQYSITGISTGTHPNNTGGNVTYPLSGAPLAAGISITIARNVPNVQLFDFPNQSAFYGTVVTAAFDYVMMCIQQLRTLFSYTLQFPITDPTPPAPLPGSGARANTLLGFDAGGAVALYQMAAPGGSALAGNGRLITASSALTVNDCYCRCDCTSGNQANTLPDVALFTNRMLILKKVDASAHAATFSGDGTIDGQASFTLAQQFNALTLWCNGTSWDIISQF